MDAPKNACDKRRVGLAEGPTPFRTEYSSFVAKYRGATYTSLSGSASRAQHLDLHTAIGIALLFGLGLGEEHRAVAVAHKGHAFGFNVVNK